MPSPRRDIDPERAKNWIRTPEQQRKTYADVEAVADVEQIVKIGFPMDTSDADALASAREQAVRSSPGSRVLSADIIVSDAHAAVGELLVRVVLGQPNPEKKRLRDAERLRTGQPVPDVPGDHSGAQDPV
jgi:hypothetical protein